MAACTVDPLPTEPDPTSATQPSVAEAPPPRPEFVALVTSRTNQVITPDFEGRVKHLYFRADEHVKAGDVIAEIDDTELKEKANQLLASEAAASADAGASYATSSESLRQAAIQDRLRRFGAASPEAAKQERARAMADGSRGASAAARARAIKEERLGVIDRIAHAKLTAPIDGVITAIKVKEGEVAHKGTPIARVFDQNDLIVRFAVPHDHRKQVKKGIRIELSLKDLERKLYAIVDRVDDELEPPIEYTMVEAKFDAASKFTPDEVHMASKGYVRLADAGGKR